jgi:hypothetical protein
MNCNKYLNLQEVPSYKPLKEYEEIVPIVETKIFCNF